ncbi:MAG: hypothetical protein JZU67_01740 [Burkholderiaceae bacterium]|jgi:serine/threonine-protein kinase|nr:hypothetical protein [Burkholderiaceae bacterium]
MRVSSGDKRIDLTVLLLIVACVMLNPVFAGDPQTILVSAEGLVDASSDRYQKDKGLMVDDLREDAKRQVVEKAVGVYVESSTLTENYQLIRDKVLTQSKGLIKQIVKESPPWVGKDGFGHMLIKAEVYVGQVQDTLQQMSRAGRVSLIKEHGDPKISVAIMIRDADRGSEVEPIRSTVAENILKGRIKGFGYRVWSEETSDKLKAEFAERSLKANQGEVAISASQTKAVDFTILGEAKFKTLSAKLAASGINVKKYVLTSWSVKCVDGNTGEEIYFNNKIPKKQSWPDEDAAIEDVGQMIGSEFSKEFFDQHLLQLTQVYQMQVVGLPSYDMGEMLKKEFIGLRPVINVDFRSFDESGFSLYEVEFSGKRSNFSKLINDTVVKPLNSKLGNNCFKFSSAHGNVVKINYQAVAGLSQNTVIAKMEEMPPASLVDATPLRLQDLIKTPETLHRVEQVNPQLTSAGSKDGVLGGEDAKNITKSF